MELAYGKQMKVKDLIKRMEQIGWQVVRVKGSHRQFRHPERPGTVTVAGKLNSDVPIGTLRAILKQAGLAKVRILI
jgi:predicted RNA binding protein YcfA (HicA-like mRNA interferase family)